MKITFYCNNGANIHSERSQEFDTLEDLGYTDEEWRNLTEDDKYGLADEWAQQILEVGFKEDE